MSGDRVHDERLQVGDAFGQVLLAGQAAGGRPGAAFEVVERSDGHLGVMDACKYFAEPPGWAAIDAAGAGRVLDLGAGAGRACLALQRRGADVTALDVSPGATEVCRQRGVHQTFTGTVADLAQTGPEPFGTFLMLGNNIGLLGGAGTAGAMLATLGRMATTGARIVGESFDPYATDDPAHLAYQEDNRRRGRLGGQVRLRIRHRLTATPWRDYLLCTPGELAALVAGTGWELVDAASPGPSGSAGGQWLAILQWRG